MKKIVILIGSVAIGACSAQIPQQPPLTALTRNSQARSGTERIRPSPFDVVLAAYRANQSRDNTRIIGGADVSLADNPWQVALVVSEISDNFQAQFCGGSYLGGRWVLTAAHCTDKDPTLFRVFRGSATLDASGRRVQVVRKLVHPGYNSSTLDNDIALLELAQSLPDRPTSVARPVDFQRLTSGSDISVTGWGVVDDAGTASRTLKGVAVPMQTMSTCNAADAYAGRVTARMFCAGRTAGGQDSCQGDSGGPATAVVDGSRRLVGVVSWGDGCAEPKRYGVYTRVSAFSDWIAANTR